MKWKIKSFLTNNLPLFFEREVEITDISRKSARAIGELLQKVESGDVLRCNFKNNYQLTFRIK